VHGIRHEEAAGLYGRRLVLVRPDGHVAWRGDRLPEDSEGLIDTARGATARQVLEATSAAALPTGP
jgi:hypothetical protein